MKKTAVVLLSSLILTSVFVAPAQAAIQPPPAALQTAAKTMYTNAKVNVRAKPSTSAKIVKSLAKGTKVSVTATKSGWSKVSGGWVRSDLLSNKKPASKEASLDKTGQEAFAAVGVNVNLRKTCSTNSSLLAKIPKGYYVLIKYANAEETWAYVNYDGIAGCMITSIPWISED